MTDQLRACPLCGQPAQSQIFDRYAGCNNKACELYGKNIPMWAWQSRPLESALNDQIEAQGKLIAELFELIDSAINFGDMEYKQSHLIDCRFTIEEWKKGQGK